MTSLRQIEANRRNALKSTGPVSAEGKQRSRCNAVRHGLTAETVIGALEDAEDYKAFEAAITSDYDAQTAVERELVLRLASLFWRLRRAIMIETGLFEIEAHQGRALQCTHTRDFNERKALYELFRHDDRVSAEPAEPRVPDNDLATCFLRMTSAPSYALDRLSRYEAALWRQAAQIIFALHALGSRRRSVFRNWAR